MRNGTAKAVIRIRLQIDLLKNAEKHLFSTTTSQPILNETMAKFENSIQKRVDRADAH